MTNIIQSNNQYKKAYYSTVKGNILYDEESKQYEIQNNTNTTIAGI